MLSGGRTRLGAGGREREKCSLNDTQVEKLSIYLDKLPILFAGNSLCSPSIFTLGDYCSALVEW